MNVEVYLKNDRCFEEYHAEADAGLYDKVFVFDAPTSESDPLAVREDVWAALNSYPQEMFISDNWTDVVTNFRSLRCRSLSVGDIITLDGVPYTVDRRGWRSFPSELLETLCTA